ncbi:hypothetical protein ACP275_09G112800 [Erythranthe tilingii]
MPKQIQKSLQECLSRMKIANKQIQLPMRSCTHTRTTSFAVEGKGKESGGGAADAAVTLSDIDQFLFENFRSLYQKEYEEETSKRKETKTAAFLLESPRFLEPPPPENLCGSARFFVTTGSSSSLIMDEASSSSTSAADHASAATTSEEEDEAAADPAAAPEDFIALLTYSPSPYEDFRRSMQEMVDARQEHNGKVDWEFLEELLFCYLDLNNKKSYRFILRAFVDLIVVLRENAGRNPASNQPWNDGGARRR